MWSDISHLFPLQNSTSHQNTELAYFLGSFTTLSNYVRAFMSEIILTLRFLPNFILGKHL